MTLTQVNKEIKKVVIKLMGKGPVAYRKEIVKNNVFTVEAKITISYESTCRIGKIVDYKLLATFNHDNNTVSLIQL